MTKDEITDFLGGRGAEVIDPPAPREALDDALADYLPPSLPTREIAALFVERERADDTPEHAIEERATDARLRAFVGQRGFTDLSDVDCQNIRDAIMPLVA